MTDNAGASTPRVLFIDDLQVGQRFTSVETRVDRDELVGFAERYDPQPFHLDDERARSTIFKGLAASGWHTASLSMSLLVDTLPFAGGVVGLSVEVSWPAPTRPGGVLHVDGHVAAIERTGRSSGVVTMKSRTLNQRGEAVQEMTARLLVQARPKIGPN